MKLLWQRFHPVALLVGAMFCALAIRVVVHGEQAAKRREEIIEELKRNNPQEISALRARLHDAGLSEAERKDLLWQIQWREKHGWAWNSAFLPGNARNPARVAGLALAAVGVACFFYKKKEPQPEGGRLRR